MAEVNLKDVVKVYPGDVRAVKGVNLAIADSEFIVLVGPSGCGKSTTLRMVAGLEGISQGTISIGDRIVNDVPPKDRDIAMVFQNYALYPHMTVYNNMAFGLKLRKFSKKDIDERVQWAAKILGIELLLDRKPKALSGGQRQRVAVGRAIVRQPKAFLFDEPLSNLDAKLRVETRAELKRLHQRLKTTTIYVTHDQEEAMTLGDRVVVMHDGEVQQCDTPMAIYQRPGNRFVAGFLGTPPMSFLDGKLVGDDGGVWFDGSGIHVKLLNEQAASCNGAVGGEATLGIRPDAVDLGGEQSGDHQFAGNVMVVETLGSQMDVFLVTPGDDRIVARIPTRSGVKPDDTITARLDMSKCHLFEPGVRGRNITLDAAKQFASS